MGIERKSEIVLLWEGVCVCVCMCVVGGGLLQQK